MALDVYTMTKFSHVLMGAAWVGGSLFFEFVVAGYLRRTLTKGDFHTQAGLLRKAGPFLGLTSVLTLITGLAYMVLKYGTDFSAIWALSNGRLILISLSLVLVAIGIGFGILLPTSLKVIRATSVDEARGPMGKLLKAGSTNLLVVLVVLFLMIVAGSGGF